MVIFGRLLHQSPADPDFSFLMPIGTGIWRFTGLLRLGPAGKISGSLLLLWSGVDAECLVRAFGLNAHGSQSVFGLLTQLGIHFIDAVNDQLWRDPLEGSAEICVRCQETVLIKDNLLIDRNLEISSDVLSERLYELLGSHHVLHLVDVEPVVDHAPHLHS
jgi:hypothetical protein